MDLAYFTENRSVQGAIGAMHAKRRGLGSGWAVSDLILPVDAPPDMPQKLQFVDLVQEGGGVLGLALVGYTYALEQMGIRFYGLGGTSAGAINTTLLSIGEIQEEKSVRTLELLSNKNLMDFVDGGYFARCMVDSLVSGSGLPMVLMKAVPLLRRILTKRGMNPGVQFHQWISDILEEHGIRTTSEWVQKRQNNPGLVCVSDPDYNFEMSKPLVKIVASDITTETKAVFPKYAEYYWEDHKQRNPADYVRASMSIPLFFYPFKAGPVPASMKSGEGYWTDQGLMSLESLKEVEFIDGGVMSNFPIDLFHREHLENPPRWPTFGARLGVGRKMNKTDSVMEMLGSTFNSARHIHDYDYLAKNPDHRLLVEHIPTHRFDDREHEHNWLNFKMKDEEKLDLFTKGVQAARVFLFGDEAGREGFDWEGYKKGRVEGFAPIRHD